MRHVAFTRLTTLKHRNAELVGPFEQVLVAASENFLFASSSTEIGMSLEVKVFHWCTSFHDDGLAWCAYMPSKYRLDSSF
jgi:hypothetical protein